MCRLFLQLFELDEGLRLHLQAAPVAPSAPEEATPDVVPLTDVSPSSLLDVATPLDSQEDVQHTLETEQRQAAVYSPNLDSAPEQTPDQIAAFADPSGNTAQSGAPGILQSLNKHAKQDKQQLASSKSGKGIASVMDAVKLKAALTCTAYVFHVSCLALYM